MLAGNLRMYGKAPFQVAVVHGGPGAAGEMAPVARELSSDRGVLEPLQTATTVHGQIEELKGVLGREADLPVSLVSFSWGAWLSLMLAARNPALVKKLLLVGSAPFEEKYAPGIMEARLARLSEKDREEVRHLIAVLDGPAAGEPNPAFARLGDLLSKADAHDPIPGPGDLIDHRVDIYRSVWNQAAEMRINGGLLKTAEGVRCPVVAVHGEHDPHPADGVRVPLSAVVRDFRFVLLKECGHKPWIERKAKDAFYAVLTEELGRVG